MIVSLSKFDGFTEVHISTNNANDFKAGIKAVSYTHLDVYKRQNEKRAPVELSPVNQRFFTAIVGVDPFGVTELFDRSTVPRSSELWMSGRPT